MAASIRSKRLAASFRPSNIHLLMTKDLVGVLDQLLTEAPGADAFHLRIRDDFADGAASDQELEEAFVEFQREFEEAVATIGSAWGAPTFQGAVDHDDFPAWSEALVLAYWRRQDALAFVSLRHDDDHEPMFLEVGALTDDEVETLLYTKS